MLILREGMSGEMRRLPSPNAEKEASRLPLISTADVCLYFKGEMVVRCDAYFFALPSAWFMSAIISSAFSIPTLNLTRSGLTPQSISCWSVS